MAETEHDQDAEERPKKRGKRRLLIIGGVVVLIAAGAFVGMQLLGGSDASAEEGPSESEPVPEGEVVEVATLTTTMAGDNNIARVGLALVLSESATADVVTPRFPLVKDAAVSELARTEAVELRTAAGADALRRRLTKRTSEIYPDGEVLRVLLTEVVVQ